MPTTHRTDPLFAVGRALLFRLDPERAHDLALASLARPGVSHWLQRRYGTRGTPTRCLGLSFDNAVGLAAGLDKNGDYIEALGALGFGHIEIGTITPRPQPGNDKPRLFRLADHGALINRMGFNNLGVEHLATQVEKRRYRGRLGINIGKNATTPLEAAEDDYRICMDRVYPLADYITVNISSPNTAGLRDLQQGERLRRLLEALQEQGAKLATRHGDRTPLVVKFAPDLEPDEIDTLCTAALEFDLDGLIMGNTTRERTAVARARHGQETGGLSGAPLRSLADAQLAAVCERLQGKVPVIGVGGISQGEHAQEKLQLGASLVQLYTGLIYRGPALVRECITATAAA